MSHLKSPGEMGSTNSRSISNINENFEFLDVFEEEDPTNGLSLKGVLLPEEIILNILSKIPPSKLLSLTLVCKKWFNIIKSSSLWMKIYYERHKIKAKKLPWYVYYCYFTTDNFSNLIKNGNGQNKFNHWRITENGGDGFIVENPPCGSDPLPSGISEFNGFTSCFATSFGYCEKYQEISFTNKRLISYIINEFRPTIYASEWMSGRFDCACIYELGVIVTRFESDLENAQNFDRVSKTVKIDQWEGRAWQKVEVLLENYQSNVKSIIFEHKGSDRQFWKGHYGSKMAGGVLKFMFDSIEPKSDD